MNRFPQITPAAARVNAGMTQEDAAKEIDVTKATIVSWEKGATTPNLEKAQRLADVYRFPLQFIIFGKEVNNRLTAMK